MIFVALTILALGSIILIYSDIKFLLLPDCITLTLLWIGLLLNTFNLFVNANSAILGASCGYIALWLVAFIFKQLRGVDGIGYGDLKLTAMFGAWFGWHILPLIIFIASILGLGFYVIKTPKPKLIPFGACIIIAGWGNIFYQLCLK
jgi:leader peptidase (prepilin peptidase)/N-methyltransferase